MDKYPSEPYFFFSFPSPPNMHTQLKYAEVGFSKPLATTGEAPDMSGKAPEVEPPV